MTATPIPRSLALTIYGDLNLSNITDKPSGRLPVKTFLVGEEKRQPAYTWIREQIVKSGYQVFIVSPLIEESESSELKHLKSAKSEYDKIRRLFPKQNVGLIHGKLKEEEKLAVIDRFRKHETDILVSTTVVEVGIDVPEANIILIESAERFGLAQLHQLRGRVGRSTKQGYCLLFPTTPTPKAQERLSLFTSTTDGAKLAEIDMKLRGPGELYGIEQHGFFSLKLANIWDFDLLEKAKSAAQMQLAINALQD